jgi:bifunctional non-homologous end joining protein LigD
MRTASAIGESKASGPKGHIVLAASHEQANLTPAMLYQFALPTKADKVPAGTGSIHEIKHDGYRMMLIRKQDRVRLISRGGHDWAEHFLLIVAAALKLRQEHFFIDGEAVVLRRDDISDFDALCSGKQGKRAQFYAFDLLA